MRQLGEKARNKTRKRKTCQKQCGKMRLCDDSWILHKVCFIFPFLEVIGGKTGEDARKTETNATHMRNT